MPKINNLPSTYYDNMQKLRPFEQEICDRDAALLMKVKNFSGYVHSSDDYEITVAGIEEMYTKTNEGILRTTSEKLGVSIEELRPKFELEVTEGNETLVKLLAQTTFNYHCFLNFALSGKKVFHFGDHITDHLANTEINVLSDYIEMPFDTCMFVYTSRVAINAFHNIRGNEGRWDMNQNGIHYDAPLTVFATLMPSTDYPDCRVLIIVAHQADAKNANSVYQTTTRQLQIAPGTSLDDCLRTDWVELAKSK